MRRAAIGLLFAFALGCGALAVGVRINGSTSFPAGFYMVTGKHAEKGDLVLVTVPTSPTLDMARDRGYLNVAYCSVNHLLKRLVGVAGDRVTIDSAGVQVNGIRMKNSTPLKCDAAGRPLITYTIKDYVIEPGEALLMSEYNPASFDSRYFGPMPAARIESTVKPLLTWN
jgi:conjugative transfer signal peptidase TraF